MDFKAEKSADNSVIKTEVIEIKQEIIDDDDEYQFDFQVTDEDYFEILKELRSKDDDLIEVEQTFVKCDYEGCSKIFKCNKFLARHKKRKHLKIKDSSDGYSICHLCGRDIKIRSYGQHIKNHERNACEDKKMYKCDFCAREFTRALYLKRHMFVHSDEKPFECNWCGKKLRSEYNLKYHMQRHIGVKEFVCDLCGKECSSRALLDKHLLTHGTNNAFQCNICNRSYRHQSTLSRHSKMHTHISKCHICYVSFRYDSHLRKHLLEEHNDVNAITQPRITPEVVKIKKKSSNVIDLETTIVDPNLYYAQPTQSTVIVNNVVDFKYSQ